MTKMISTIRKIFIKPKEDLKLLDKFKFTSKYIEGLFFNDFPVNIDRLYSGVVEDICNADYEESNSSKIKIIPKFDKRSFYLCGCGNRFYAPKNIKFIDVSCLSCGNKKFHSVNSGLIGKESYKLIEKEKSFTLIKYKRYYRLGKELNLFLKDSWINYFYISKNTGAISCINSCNGKSQPLEFSTLDNFRDKINTGLKENPSLFFPIFKEKEKFDLFNKFNCSDYRLSDITNKSFKELMVQLFGENGKKKSIIKTFISILEDDCITAHSFLVYQTLSKNFKDVNNLQKVLNNRAFMMQILGNFSTITSLESNSLTFKRKIFFLYFELLVSWYGENRLANLISKDYYYDLDFQHEERLQIIDTLKSLYFRDEYRENIRFFHKKSILKSLKNHRKSNDFIKDFHDGVTAFYRKKTTLNRVYSYHKEIKELVIDFNSRFVSEKFKLHLPKDTDELYSFGNDLHNCMARYNYDILDMNEFIVGFYIDTELCGGLRFDYDLNYCYEFKLKFNDLPSEELQNLMFEYLKEKKFKEIMF